MERNTPRMPPAKRLLLLSLTPYALAVLYALSHCFTSYPLDDFISALWYDLWLDLVLNRAFGGLFTALVACCAAYQIWYAVARLHTRGKAKALRVLLLLSALIWVFYGFLGLYAYCYGFDVWLFGGKMVYGTEALINALGFWGMVLCAFPVLPLSVFYAAAYCVVRLQAKRSPR